MAGMMASKIFYTGATLPQFKVELVGLVVLLVFAILGPMLVFAPKLEAAKRAGLREYGTLAQRYVREFDNKWLRGDAPIDEPLHWQRRHPVAGRPGQQLRGGERHAMGAVHRADSPAAGGHHAAAGACR